MDRVYEKEKSSRRTSDERDRGDRDSSKDHHREHRDREHRHRSSREDPSKESEERHQGDREHRHRSSRDDPARESEERYRGDRERKHRSSREDRSRESEERHHSDRYREEKRLSKDEKHRESDRHRSREKSQDPMGGREGSREERVLREESIERRPYSSNKRKERSESEDRSEKSDKRIRASNEEKRPKDERREKRKFEDKAVEEARELNGNVEEEKRGGMEVEDGGKEEVVARELNGGSRREKRKERRRFEDRAKEDDMGLAEEEKQLHGAKFEKNLEEQMNSNAEGITSNANDSITNGAAAEPLNSTFGVMPENIPAFSHPPPTKVSSISTTNENKGVSVTRSHEVPGKSSTDVATTSAAGKSGSLSLDALAKAKKALQMQKELSEKLKKIPLLNKVANSTSDGDTQVGLNEGSKAPMSSTKTENDSIHLTAAAVVASMQVSLSTTILPATSASVKPSSSGMAALGGLTTTANYEAVKRAQELAAKMGFRHDPEFAPLINMFPGHMPAEITAPQKPAKAPVLRLDALGREIDEYGNVINMPKPTNLSTLKVNINKQKKEAFQILKPELEVDPESNPHFDASMGINKTKLLRPKRMSFQFVEEGKWSREADRMKNKSEAQAKELKIKQAQLAKAKAEPYINPNLIEVSERVITKEKPKDPIPDVEWWDVVLLPSGSYGEITEDMTIEDKLKKDKITIYVEHPLPIEPPAEPAPPPPQPLKLTKKEQKKLRTQRRLAKEKDRQEMIRQGLIEPPKPKIKMSNLMKVLGSEATQDPTRLEMEIRTSAAEREQAHVDRNIARKLTPAERREKKERKLFEDPNTLESIVSVYKINDLTHPQTRFKVDVNAQENRLTGCAVITEDMCVVVVEGGSKPIKRYSKLMLRRINWAAAVPNEDEEEEEDDKKPVNKCMLVWQGSVAKPSFNRFTVHQCITEAAGRKVFSDAGVGHYWDLAVNFTDEEI